MNKIRIIDLLNKIANNEETPNKIRFNGEYYFYNTTYDDYKSPSTWLLKNNNDNLNCFLNDEVEIIEEDKTMKYCKGYECFNSIDDYIEHLKSKIDKLIDEINKLKSGEND